MIVEQCPTDGIVKIGEIGRSYMPTTIKHVLRKLSLAFQELIKLLVKCSEVFGYDNWIVDVYVFCLTDTVGTVRCLIFSSWIPSSCEVDYVICSLNIQPKAHCQRRQDDHPKSPRFLKLLDPPLA